MLSHGGIRGGNAEPRACGNRSAGNEEGGHASQGWSNGWRQPHWLSRVLGQHQDTPRGPLVRESRAVLCPDHTAWTGSGLRVLAPAAAYWQQGVRGEGGPGGGDGGDP